MSLIYSLSVKLDIRKMVTKDVRPRGGCCRPRILRRSLFALEQTSRRKRSNVAILSLSSYFLSAPVLLAIYVIHLFIWLSFILIRIKYLTLPTSYVNFSESKSYKRENSCFQYDTNIQQVLSLSLSLSRLNNTRVWRKFHSFL